MDPETKGQFGDPNFDVKAWLNAQMKQPLPEEGASASSTAVPASQVPVAKYEKRAQKLSQVLQAESTAVANSLDSAISQALTRLPRSEKEIEKMVNETTSLSTQLEAIGEKSCSTKTPHEHSQQLQKLHHINAKLRRCSEALETASEISDQVDRIEHSISQGFDGGMDADALAVEISKVDKSLAALQKIDPSFGQNLRSKIDSFGTQLEQSLESACLDALRRQDKVKAPTLLATLQTINRDGPVLDQYIEGLVESKRNSFLKDLEAANQSSVKSTLASFHRSNAKFLKHEHDYHLAIVGGAAEPEQAVRGLQLKYLTRLYSSVSARIEAKLAKTEDNDIIVSSFEASGLVAATNGTEALSQSGNTAATSSTTNPSSTNATAATKQSGIETFLEFPEVLEEVSKPFRHLVDKPFTQREESKLRSLVDAAIRVIQATTEGPGGSSSSSSPEVEEAEIEKSVSAVLEQVEGWANRAFRYLPDKSIGPAVRSWNSELQRLGTTLLEKVALLGAGITAVVAADLGENEAFRQILSLHTSCITTEKLFSDCEKRLNEAASQSRYHGPFTGGPWLTAALQSVSVLTEKSGQRLRQILTAPLEGTIQEYVTLPCWAGQGGSTASGYQAKPSGPCDTLREAGESFMELLYQLGQTNMEEAQKEKLIAMTGAGFTAHYVAKVKEIVFTQQESSSSVDESEKSASSPGVAPVKKEGSFAQLQLVDDVEYLSKVLNTVISDDELRSSCVAQIDELLKN